MAAAVRQAAKPLLKSFGFRNPKKGDFFRWFAERPNVFLRYTADGEYDEVSFVWSATGYARFRIQLASTRASLMAPPGQPKPRYFMSGGVLLRSKLSCGPIYVFGFETFGMFASVNGTVELVLRRLDNLNSYLLTGAPGGHIHGWLYSAGRWNDRGPSGTVALPEEDADPWGMVSFDELLAFGLVEPLERPRRKRKRPELVSGPPQSLPSDDTD